MKNTNIITINGATFEVLENRTVKGLTDTMRGLDEKTGAYKGFTYLTGLNARGRKGITLDVIKALINKYLHAVPATPEKAAKDPVKRGTSFVNRDRAFDRLTVNKPVIKDGNGNEYRVKGSDPVKAVVNALNAGATNLMALHAGLKSAGIVHTCTSKHIVVNGVCDIWGRATGLRVNSYEMFTRAGVLKLYNIDRYENVGDYDLKEYTCSFLAGDIRGLMIDILERTRK